MRRLKFRAWQQYSLHMFEVTGMIWSAAIDRWFSRLELLSLDGMHTVRNVTGEACENYILMQYTGLKDKDGKKIYEGDIVYSDYYKANFEVCWCDGKGEFLRSQIGWMLDDRKFCFTGHTAPLEAHLEWNEGDREEYFQGSVIGNVYENPEMLRDVNTKVVQ